MIRPDGRVHDTAVGCGTAVADGVNGVNDGALMFGLGAVGLNSYDGTKAVTFVDMAGGMFGFYY